MRQTQKVTANTTNVTDSPCCPAELVFGVILLVFIVVPSTLAADTSRYSTAKVILFLEMLVISEQTPVKGRYLLIHHQFAHHSLTVHIAVQYDQFEEPGVGFEVYAISHKASRSFPSGSLTSEYVGADA